MSCAVTWCPWRPSEQCSCAVTHCHNPLTGLQHSSTLAYGARLTSLQSENRSCKEMSFHFHLILISISFSSIKSEISISFSSITNKISISSSSFTCVINISTRKMCKKHQASCSRITDLRVELLEECLSIGWNQNFKVGLKQLQLFSQEYSEI